MVGLTPAELESLNELIHIDHIYVKSQPETPQSQTVISDNEDEDDSHIHESSDIPVEMEMYVSQEAASTTEVSLSELPKQVSSPDLISNSINLVSESDDSCVVSLGSEAVVKKEIPDNFADVLNSDDILESFSDSDIDMEATWSLDLLDQLGLEQRTNDNILLDETRASLASLQSTSIQSTNFKLPETPDVIAELDSSHFFSNIENFLYENENMNDSSVKPSSPLSISNSDSDFYSDTAGETLSPLGSEVSLLEDLPWNDSFRDLFPEIM